MFLSKRMLKKKPAGDPGHDFFLCVCALGIFSSAFVRPRTGGAGMFDGRPSFALFTIGTLYYMDSIAPADIRTTYQTVAYSIYFGLSGIGEIWPVAG